MEKKTKHRLLGFAVIVALVVMIFPFIEKEKGLPAQTASYVPPPPFPAPSNAANTVNEQPDDVISQQTLPEASNPKVASNTVGNVIPIIPVEPIAESKAPIAKIKKVDQGEMQIQQEKPISVQSATDTSLQHEIATELSTIKTQIVSNTKQKIAEFSEVKSNAWVVQLGVFREKNNAIRLVNQLRTNGYRAFITKNGSMTKVFVGPENKQLAARNLASRLEQEMHIKGMVINYKPFTL
jgi:DedD protein